MKNIKYKVRPIVLLLTVAMILTLLSTTALAAGSEYDSKGATYFTFTDSGITAVDGDYTDYKIDGAALSIKAAGTYVVSGTCPDGSITIKKGVTGVTLVLNGLTLTNTGSATTATAPITCNKSSGVNIVVASGTINTLADSIYNNDDSYPDNDNAESAVIKCKDGSQVTITGSGTLNIVSNGKNGIKSGTTDAETDPSNPRDAFLTISGPTLNIYTTVNDAINAEHELNILSGTLTISAEDDAIHSDLFMNIGASGTVGPTIDIKKSNEGIEAATLNIYSGNISIISTDDCINAANSDLTDYAFSITVSGGNISAYTSSGDGFDSNGKLTISSGNIEVWSASTADNQPLDADGTVSITGGTVLAAGGSPGMGMNLSVSQPYVIFGSGRQMGGRPMSEFPAMSPGQIPTGQQPTPPTGQMPGGVQPTLPSGQMPGGVQPTSPTGQMPGSEQGIQPSDRQMNGQNILQNIILSEGSTVTIQDSSGKILYNGTALCNTSYIIFSSSSMTAGENYTLTANSNTVATATAGTTFVPIGGNIPPQGPNSQTGNNGNIPAQPANPQTGNTGNMSAQPTNPQTDNNGNIPAQPANPQTDNSGNIPAQPANPQSDNTSNIPAQPANPQTDNTGNMPAQPANPQSGNDQSSDVHFNDVKEDDWFYDYVLYVANQGLMSGTSKTEFSPNLNITRGMLVTILYRLDGSPEVTGTNKFTNVPKGQYYTNAVIWASENNIISGYDNAKFGPNDNVTREQFATILYRYASAKGYDTSAQGNLSSFADSKSISEYAKQGVSWAVGMGIINGSNSYINASGYTARAQAAVMLAKFCQVVGIGTETNPGMTPGNPTPNGNMPTSSANTGRGKYVLSDGETLNGSTCISTESDVSAIRTYNGITSVLDGVTVQKTVVIHQVLRFPTFTA